MSAPQKIAGQNKLAPVCALMNLAIPVAGPFVTPNDLCIYVVDGCIVTRAELRALYDSDQLTVESLAAVRSDLRRLPTA